MEKQLHEIQERLNRSESENQFLRRILGAQTSATELLTLTTMDLERVLERHITDLERMHQNVKTIHQKLTQVSQVQKPPQQPKP